MAAAGIWYNTLYLTAHYSEILSRLNAEGSQASGGESSLFYSVFYVLSGICIAFYVLLAITGIQLVRIKTGWVFVLIGVMIAELAYFPLLGSLWALPEYGRTVAAASTISSGGLAFQGISLFPIWGPFGAFWARKQIRKSADADVSCAGKTIKGVGYK